MWFPNKLAYADFEKENINKKTVTNTNILKLEGEIPFIIMIIFLFLDWWQYFAQKPAALHHHRQLC